MWQKYEWENRIPINTNIDDLFEFIKHVEQTFKLKIINEDANLKESKCVCVNFYAKTKLDDDFLINLSAEIIE